MEQITKETHNRKLNLSGIKLKKNNYSYATHKQLITPSTKLKKYKLI